MKKRYEIKRYRRTRYETQLENKTFLIKGTVFFCFAYLLIWALQNPLKLIRKAANEKIKHLVLLHIKKELNVPKGSRSLICIFINFDQAFLIRSFFYNFAQNSNNWLYWLLPAMTAWILQMCTLVKVVHVHYILIKVLSFKTAQQQVVGVRQ